MIIQINKRTRAVLIAVLMCTISIILSACQVKPVMEPKKVHDNFNIINAALITTDGTVANATKNKSKKSKENVIRYSKTDLNTLKAQKDNVNKVISSFKGTRVDLGLQKETLDYAHNVLRYINTAEKTTQPVELTADYHNLATQSAKIFRKMPNSLKKTGDDRIVASVLAFDVKQQQEDRTTHIGDNSSNASTSPIYGKAGSSIDRKTPQDKIFYPSKTKAASLEIDIALILMSGLLILFVFLQPSKANDSMNALADTAGNDLLSEAKPDDYTLFLMRGTGVFATAIIVILGILEFGNF